MSKERPNSAVRELTIAVNCLAICKVIQPRQHLSIAVVGKARKHLSRGIVLICRLSIILVKLIKVIGIRIVVLCKYSGPIFVLYHRALCHGTDSIKCFINGIIFFTANIILRIRSKRHDYSLLIFYFERVHLIRSQPIMKCKSVVNNFAIYYFFSIFSHLQFYFCRSKNYVALFC